MLRKKSKEELGFSPDIVSAVGFGTPPCVSKVLAENCASYVSSVVPIMYQALGSDELLTYIQFLTACLFVLSLFLYSQDDIIPRLSVASLARLRKEILETEWMTVLQKEDWKGIVDIVTNAKQFVSSVQDVARRLANYTKFSKMSDDSHISVTKDSAPSQKKPDSEAKTIVKLESAAPKELLTPGMCIS